MPFAETPKFPAEVAGVDHLNNWEGLTLAGPGELAANISDTVTSFNVKTGHGARYPDDNFTIEIFNPWERMFVAVKTVDTLSGITRGIDGTAAASHNLDDPVEHFIDARFLNRIASEVNALQKKLQGLALSQPINGITKPVNGDFSWDNQDNATITEDSEGNLFVRNPGTSGSLSSRIKTAPSTPYTITAGIVPFVPGTTGAQAGLVVRESSTGKLIQFGPHRDIGLSVSKYTNGDTFSAHYLTLDIVAFAGILWLQITDNGTNLLFNVSVDGRNFIQIHSVSRTDFMAGGPDEVGFGVAKSSTPSTVDAGMTLVHWDES